MHFFILIILIIMTTAEAWRAIPANQASFSQRRQIAFIQDNAIVTDAYLPRTALHSVYKFGWCRPDALSKVYLKRTASIHFGSFEETQAEYVYLLEHKNTQRFRHQCVVMKIMVPTKYLFRRSRLPLYYCQGTMYYVMFNFVQRMEVHELYLHSKLSMPADLNFEFYHPPTYDTNAKEIFHSPLYY